MKNLLKAILILKIEYNLKNIVVLTITGNGRKSTLDYINYFIERHNLQKNVNLLGYLDKASLKKVQLEQDLLVVFRSNSLHGRFSFSTKLADYLHLGKLSLMNIISDNHLYIKDGFNGFLINNTNPELIALKINQILKLSISESKLVSA